MPRSKKRRSLYFVIVLDFAKNYTNECAGEQRKHIVYGILAVKSDAMRLTAKAVKTIGIHCGRKLGGSGNQSIGLYQDVANFLHMGGTAALLGSLFAKNPKMIRKLEIAGLGSHLGGMGLYIKTRRSYCV